MLEGTSREFKSSVTADGVSQFLLQCGLLLIVGELQQVEAGGGRGQPVDRILLPQSQEPSQDRAHRVSIILVLRNLHTSATRGVSRGSRFQPLLI